MSTAVARKLESITKKGAMKSVDIANLLGARPETVSRWNTGKSYPHPGAEKTLVELEYIVDELSELYEPNEARLWMFKRQRLLNGVSPADLIREGQIDEVLSLVNQLRDGVHM